MAPRLPRDRPIRPRAARRPYASAPGLTSMQVTLVIDDSVLNVALLVIAGGSPTSCPTPRASTSGPPSSVNQAMRQPGGAAGPAVLSTVFAGTAGGSGAATGISTALTVATAFPLLALLLFAVWARPTAAR